MSKSQIKLLSIEKYDENLYTPVKYIDAMEVQTINIFRQIMASFGALVGGPTKMSGITNKIEEVKKRAIHKLKNKARKANCSLIIGVRVQVSELSTKNDGMMVIQVSGTAMKKRTKQNNNNQ